ncbi:unnamed protein product [Ectocarpus fasciculatus]
MATHGWCDIFLGFIARCQANTPTDFCFSFRGFRERGGRTGRHVDGWGVAFFEGKGFRNFCDSLPSALSPIANLICNYPIKTRTVIAHVRMATQGRVRLENVHPFSRELWGSYWIFAHNGDVPSAKDAAKRAVFLKTKSKRYTPVGDTDSEAVFCFFLNRLLDAFPDAPPNMADVFVELKRVWQELCSESGVIFNFLLGQGGDTLFAGCWPGARPGSEVWNSLYYTVREFPFTTCQLVDDDCEVDFDTVTTPSDRVAVIATAPLTTNEVWCEMAKGDMLAFHGGQPFSSPDDFRRQLRTKVVDISVRSNAGA